MPFASQALCPSTWRDWKRWWRETTSPRLSCLGNSSGGARDATELNKAQIKWQQNFPKRNSQLPLLALSQTDNEGVEGGYGPGGVKASFLILQGRTPPPFLSLTPLPATLSPFFPFALSCRHIYVNEVARLRILWVTLFYCTHLLLESLIHWSSRRS